MAMDADVAVVGVGSVGSMALWQLAEAGVRAIGFEQFSPGHGYGGAGGETRYFRTAYAEGEAYVPLLFAAYELWARLEAEAGATLTRKCGLLTIGPSTDERLRQAEACAKRWNIEVEILDATAAGARYPQHRFRPDDWVLVDKLAGLISSEYAVVCAARLAERYGAIIHRHCRVGRVIPEGDGVTIATAKRAFRVGKAIIATGGWVQELLPETRSVLTPRRTWQSWYPSVTPERFSPEDFPVFGRTLQGLRLHGAPTLDGRLVCVGAVAELPEVQRQDSVLGPETMPDLSVVNDYVRDYIAGLIPDPVRVQPALDGYTVDGHALVGLHPRSDNVVLLCGFSGHGFKLAPIMGRIAADLALLGSTAHPIGHLDLDRFALFPVPAAVGA